MKMQGRWVAWMAALALAAMLVAAPREGAAGPHPYLFPDPPPGPSLGEPDMPPSRPQLISSERSWLKGLRIRLVWTRGSILPLPIPSSLIGRASTMRAGSSKG